MDFRSWEDIGTNCFVGVKNGATIVLKNEIIKKYFKSNFKNI